MLLVSPVQPGQPAVGTGNDCGPGQPAPDRPRACSSAAAVRCVSLSRAVAPCSVPSQMSRTSALASVPMAARRPSSVSARRRITSSCFPLLDLLTTFWPPRPRRGSSLSAPHARSGSAVNTAIAAHIRLVYPFWLPLSRPCSSHAITLISQRARSRPPDSRPQRADSHLIAGVGRRTPLASVLAPASRRRAGRWRVVHLVVVAKVPVVRMICVPPSRSNIALPSRGQCSRLLQACALFCWHRDSCVSGQPAGCCCDQCTKRSCSLGEAVMVTGWRRLVDGLVEQLMSP
jgi:hypothetical protein